MTPSLVSVIVPVFGEEKLLRTCLAALAGHTGDHELVLVDNGTGYEFPDDVVEVRNPDNLGFATGCNQGADASSADVLVFLNVDTEVHEGWLPPLLRAFDDPSTGMAGSKLLYPDGSIQHSGIEFVYGGRIKATNRREDAPASSVDGVTGACMAIRRSVFDDCGGFDENYWNGYDDVDLCLSVRAHGFQIRYEPESVVTHLESATGPERWSGRDHNIARLQEKWGSWTP